MKRMLLFVVLLFPFLPLQAQIKVISNGYVGINATTPAFRFDINSAESRHYASSYPSRYSLMINHWGTDPRLCSTSKIVFYKSDGSGYIDIQCKTLYQSSDRNDKENVTPLSAGNNLDKIKKLQGINYTWKEDKANKIQAGLLAQDVEAIIPEAVMTNDSTKQKSLSYSAIIPYLVEAVKEQQAEIEELKKQLNR